MHWQYSKQELLSGGAFRAWIGSLPAHWQHLPPYLRLYAWILIAAGLLFQLSYPISLSDSDMWYHLDSGRSFWQQLAIPDDAFFSFIQPERTFVNYYWGFQALIAKVYDYSGYYGLLVLRALLFALTTVLAYRYIVEERNGDFPVLFFILLFIAYFTFIEGRAANLRPHLFSHLFILLFLYILDRRPRWTPALPFITAAWANLHGIEYPVPALIGGAYFIELLYRRYIAKRSRGAVDWTLGVSLLACIPALLATPHGIDLLMAPFSVAEQASMYINEMKPLNSKIFYSLFLSGDNLTIESVFSIAFLLCTFALIRCLISGTLRISHGIMAVGGYLLLIKGNRFVWEWALLVLPLLTHFTASLESPRNGRQLFSIVNLLVAIVMVLPLVSMAKRLPLHQEYPLDSDSVPTGISRFLSQHGGGGKLFAPPSMAGYLHWRLYPDYRIYADLQMSLFRDLDIYSMFSFYRNKHGLARILEGYRPEYVSVTLKNSEFSKLIAGWPEYVPVFAGDKQVLYVNRSLRPEIAAKFELKLVNPFSLTELKPNVALDEHLKELQAMLDIYPESDRINHGITRMLFNEKRYAEALIWAARFVNFRPANPNSHYLLGNIHENTGDCDQAIKHYRDAMRYSNDERFNLSLHTHIGSCSYVLEDFTSAYSHLSRAINPYAQAASEEDIYQLAFSAFIVGETEESILLLKMLLQNAPSEQTELTREAGKLLETLGEHGDQTPSFVEWLWVTAISWSQPNPQ